MQNARDSKTKSHLVFHITFFFISSLYSHTFGIDLQKNISNLKRSNTKQLLNINFCIAMIAVTHTNKLQINQKQANSMKLCTLQLAYPFATIFHYSTTVSTKMTMTTTGRKAKQERPPLRQHRLTCRHRPAVGQSVAALGSIRPRTNNGMAATVNSGTGKSLTKASRGQCSNCTHLWEFDGTYTN